MADSPPNGTMFLNLTMLTGAAMFFTLPAGAQTQPTIVGSPLRWITNAYYPSAALRQGREGRARYKLTIDASGRVTRCDIMTSSGHADLDDLTCRLISRRARFVKTSETDQPRYFESMFSWNIYR